MFGLMKNPIKESAPSVDAVKLNEMHTGCVVGFGFMSQKNLSGKRIPISEINTYLFDAENFVSYRLENDSVDVSLIVADEEVTAGTYLALSQRIEPRFFQAAFHEDKKPGQWFSLKSGDKIKVVTQPLGPLQGWLVSEYTAALLTPGHFLAGDYRQRKLADPTALARPFEYVLLLDEDNEYALEAEKYADGTFNVFATIYRPATDIGEITRGTKSTGVPLMNSPDLSKPPLSIDIIAHERPVDVSGSTVKPDVGNPFLLKETAKSESAKSSMSSSTMPEQVVPDVKPPAELKQPVAAEIITPELTTQASLPPAGQKSEEGSATSLEATSAPEAKKISENLSAESLKITPPEALKEDKARLLEAHLIHPSPAIPDPHMLACDLELAKKLIEEALRNQMQLSDVIRKVVDLKPRFYDQILIPFTLDDAEVAALAKRYELSSSDLQAVKLKIVEELKRFVGKMK